MFAQIRRVLRSLTGPGARGLPTPAAAAPLGLELADPIAGTRQRVLVVADAYAATQFISFTQPLASARADGRTALAVLTEASLDALPGPAAAAGLAQLWAEFRPTCVVISRAATRRVGMIVRQCQETGVRLVAHLDDDLFAVPEELGAGKAARHNDPARLARLTIACRRADIIYASTPVLAERLQERFPDRRVVSGRIYAAAAEPFASFAPRAPRTIGYMGTAGHAADLAEITPAIERILDRFDDVEFETFGTIKPPPSLARFGRRVRAHGRENDYPAFLARLRELGWIAGLAPLRPTAFNACKADTKFVEYAQAGIPPVLARSAVYQRPLAAAAALGAATPDEWETAIAGLLDGEVDASSLMRSTRDCLRNHYAPTMLQRQLEDVLTGEFTGGLGFAAAPSTGRRECRVEP